MDFNLKKRVWATSQHNGCHNILYYQKKKKMLFLLFWNSDGHLESAIELKCEANASHISFAHKDNQEAMYECVQFPGFAKL